MNNPDSHEIEKNMIETVDDLSEVFYEKYCGGEITFQELQAGYQEMRTFAAQAERLLNRIS